MDFDVLTGKSLIRRNGLDKVFCLQKMRSLYGKCGCPDRNKTYEKTKIVVRI